MTDIAIRVENLSKRYLFDRLTATPATSPATSTRGGRTGSRRGLEPEVLLVGEVLLLLDATPSPHLRYARANGKIVVRPCLCYNLEESGRLRLDWLSDDERE